MIFCCKIKDHNFKSELDDDLLTGYLSAFFYFSRDILHDPVQHFTTRYHHYCLITKDNLMFAGRFLKSELGNSLPLELDNLISHFLQEPEEVLKKFRYNEASILEIKNVLKNNLNITNSYF